MRETPNSRAIRLLPRPWPDSSRIRSTTSGASILVSSCVVRRWTRVTSVWSACMSCRLTKSESTLSIAPPCQVYRRGSVLVSPGGSVLVSPDSVVVSRGGRARQLTHGPLSLPGHAGVGGTLANDHRGFTGTWETLPSPSHLPAGEPG